MHLPKSPLAPPILLYPIQLVKIDGILTQTLKSISPESFDDHVYPVSH